MRLNRTVSKGKVHYVVHEDIMVYIFFDDRIRNIPYGSFSRRTENKAVIHAFQLLQHEAPVVVTPNEENSIALTVQSVGRVCRASTTLGEDWDALGWSI